MVSERVYERMDIFKDRIQALETYEQLLHEERGYITEHIGKWHVPMEQYYKRGSKQRRPDDRVIAHNFYDFRTEQPIFVEDIFKHADFGENRFAEQQQFLVQRDGVTVPFHDNWQLNWFSGFPYRPISLDIRYGMPTNSPGTPRLEELFGEDGLPAPYTRTAVLGEMSVRALERLATSGQPFTLAVHHYSPHPVRSKRYILGTLVDGPAHLAYPVDSQMIATSDYFGHYNDARDLLHRPESIDDDLKDSGFDYLMVENRGHND